MLMPLPVMSYPIRWHSFFGFYVLVFCSRFIFIFTFISIFICCFCLLAFFSSYFVSNSFGRRVVYYISVIFCSIGRLSSIVTTSHYTWFLVFSGLTALTINSLFQSPQIIGMEISRE